MRAEFAFALILAINSGYAGANSVADYLTQPALSPDATEIAFVSGGDIWTVPAAGGVAQLLVSGEATESRPLYSPDGKQLAFISTRSGNGDIYTLDLASGKLSRITWDDGFDNLSAWSRDGEWLYFSSTRDNVGNMNGVYRVRASGGTPMPVSKEDYRNHEGAVPSPDGRDIALTGNGTGERQWWRNGHSNLEVGAIWMLRDDGKYSYQRVTPDDARALWPMWNADGSAIYYMSDRGGQENIWRATREGEVQPATRFVDGRVLWPSISANGKTIAFARDFGLWTLDVASGNIRPVPVRLRGTATIQSVRHESLSKDFSHLSVAPDGKKLAFVARGEVFAAATDKGGRADRITRTPGAEFHVAWSPDSQRLVYASARHGKSRLYLYDFVRRTESELTDGKGADMHPQFSPDGRHLAFVRDSRELRVIEMNSRRQRELVSAAIDLVHPLEADRPFTWSPDSRWIAYQAYGERMFRNAWVVPLGSGKPQAVSFLANVGADSITWSPDGTSVFFTTGQRTEAAQVARVDLVARTPKFAEESFRNLFNEQTPPSMPSSPKVESLSSTSDEKSAATAGNKSATNVRVDVQGIRERLALLPTGLNVDAIEISPDGKNLLLTAELAGRKNLYLYSIDELDDEPAVPRQLTSSPAPKAFAQFSRDGKSVYFLEGGRIAAITIDDGRQRVVNVSADLELDFNREKQVVLDQTWRWLRDGFHDTGMNGVDWEAQRARYEPLLANAQTPDAMRELLNLMIGELDASHTGVRPPGALEFSTGRIGLRFDRKEYERHGRLRVNDVLPRSASDITGKISVGDVLVAVNGEAIDAGTNLDRLLANRSGRETNLRFASNGKTFEVRVKPIDARTEAALAYRAWIAANREYVARASKGRLGYVHMFDMSWDSLQRLYVDLDAENATRDGVVIDVRNNFGGFVNAYALDVFSRQPYLNMRFRGQSAVSARSVLGQRALERPTVLVTNRVTLSDGEDFSEGYRRLGLGKIVGEPTSGWIIYTSNVSMIDGSILRIPFITITTADGQPMEMAPRPVDVRVERPLGEGYRGIDSELDAAVRVLSESAAR
jgi:tricorn protease